MTWSIRGILMASHNCSPVTTPRVPVQHRGSVFQVDQQQGRPSNSFFMPHVTRQFIECDDLCGGRLIWATSSTRAFIHWSLAYSVGSCSTLSQGIASNARSRQPYRVLAQLLAANDRNICLKLARPRDDRWSRIGSVP